MSVYISTGLGDAEQAYDCWLGWQLIGILSGCMVASAGLSWGREGQGRVWVASFTDSSNKYTHDGDAVVRKILRCAFVSFEALLYSIHHPILTASHHHIRTPPANALQDA